MTPMHELMGHDKELGSMVVEYALGTDTVEDLTELFKDDSVESALIVGTSPLVATCGISPISHGMRVDTTSADTDVYVSGGVSSIKKETASHMDVHTQNELAEIMREGVG